MAYGSSLCFQRYRQEPIGPQLALLLPIVYPRVF